MLSQRRKNELVTETETKLDRIRRLRQEMRGHAERAGVNRCYCVACGLAEREVVALLRSETAGAGVG